MGPLGSILLGVGCVLVYAAQKIWLDGGAHTALLWAGAAAAAGAGVVRAVDFAQAKGARRQAEAGLFVATAGVLLSLGLYALTTEWGAGILGAKEGDKAPVLIAVLWPAVLVVSSLALLFMELVYRRMPIAEAIELRRIRASALDGIAIGLALVFAISVNYAADKDDVRKDLSYFKTAMPSESSVRMVKSVSEPMRAVLFFPKTNEVLQEIRPYFDTLQRSSGAFKVEVMDHALAPTLATAHRVKDNGIVLLLKGPDGHGQQAQQLDIGTDLALARSKLRTLDARFQQSFTQLARQKREIYFTVGHQERSDNGYTEGPADERTAQLVKALDRANVKLKSFGINDGLAREVPAAAPAVAVMGPRAPLLPEEVNALLAYVRAGGRLLVAVDPTDDHGLAPLLDALGIVLKPGVLVSDTFYYPRSRTEADRAIVLAKRFSSHPTVTTASKHAKELAFAFIRGGALDKKEGEAPKGTKLIFPIRSEGSFWLDQNGNFQLDGEEKRAVSSMMAAVTVEVPAGAQPAPADKAAEPKEGRVVVVADADFATDQVIGNLGNLVVINDVLQWLLGAEEIVTQTASEEDVPIEHTREEDKVWFYGTSLGAPLPLFALGIWVAVRRRRRPTRADARGRTAAGAAGAASGTAPGAAPESPKAEEVKS